jgi:protein kinase C substrate 80K-H
MAPLSSSLLSVLVFSAIARADGPKPVIPSQIRGLDPARKSHPCLAPSSLMRLMTVYSRYEPSGGVFTCLDGSRTIPHSAINDDYCDCPDGSDEPGTSACENSSVRFYCRNEGHVPGSVKVSRVNDGICGRSSIPWVVEWS